VRYRKLSPPPFTNVFNLQGGDYSFGHSATDFYIDVPEAPAQLCLTRLGLFLGDWFLDLTDGTDWNAEVLGRLTESTRDPIIQLRILGTKNVTGIISYSSSLDRNTRKFGVSAQIDTTFGAIEIQGPI
jgi:hypothetical protein